MIQSLDRIAELTSRIDEARLRADWVLQNALVHEMQVFGEAAGRLSDNVKDEFDDIPWRKVNGLRNRLVHEYFAVDLGLVWDTATRDMPAIRSTVLDLRRRLNE
jgi:uncharacterized protein with HEPN domain